MIVVLQHIANWPIIVSWPFSYLCLFTDSCRRPDDPLSQDLRTKDAADNNSDILPADLDFLDWTGSLTR